MADRALYEWFSDSADRFPAEPALEVDGQSLTYRELRVAAENVARRIVAEHGSVPARLALLASRTVVAFAGYLAASRLGCVVTPLNPGYPVRRNRDVCALAEVDVLLADPAGAAQAAELSGLTSTVLKLSTVDYHAGELPPYRVELDDVAYVLFTSGSTGRPKGVPIRHRNLAPYLAHNIARYEVGPGCRMSHTFDLTFDPSVFDLFVTWGGGATLVVPQRTELLEPVRYVADRGITHWFSVPSVVSVSADLGNLPTGLATSLRHSVFIGEQLTFAQARAWRAVAPDATIENVYGPTELTVACTEYALPRDPEQWPSTSNDTVPIGPVYDFLDFVVLDEEGNPAEEGELCVRGAQRFGGYLDERDDAGRFLTLLGGTVTVHDEGELTEAHYYRTGDRVRLESGNWVHLGRLDQQVKIRGYRVELGDIEATMRRHDDVNDAIVIAMKRDEETELFGFYTGRELSTVDMVRRLRKQLPIHMVPRRFTRLDEIPLNVNGKADRPALRLMLTAGSATH
ncbi:MAG: amino acid adenylation domain-containing protein [Pseudonocardiaceae bacterium]